MAEKTSLEQARDKAMAKDASPQDEIAYFVAERDFWAKVRDERGESDEDQYVETIFGNWFTLIEEIEFRDAPADYTPENLVHAMKEIEDATWSNIVYYEHGLPTAKNGRDLVYVLAANYSFYKLIKDFAKGA